MVIKELVKSPGAWLSVTGNTGIVISSRVRLARNLNGYRFPEAATPEQAVQLAAELRHAFDVCAGVAGEIAWFDMARISQTEKEVLTERHLISPELCRRGAGSGLLVAEDEGLAVMLNEEDHLRMQVIAPGFRLTELWQRLDALDTRLEHCLDYAYSPAIGYLTACPTNVGTGLRASAMLHLPGLRLTGEVDAALNGLTRIGLAVRGLLGEGTAAYGNMYQISNQISLGQTEEHIITRLIGLVGEMVTHEQNARARLLESKRAVLADHVARAYGVLTQARIISTDEALDWLSALRLGVELEWVAGLTIPRLNELVLMIQPGHLKVAIGRALRSVERDALRADRLREQLREVRLTV